MYAYDRHLFPRGSMARRAVRRALRLVRDNAPGLADRLMPVKRRLEEAMRVRRTRVEEGLAPAALVGEALPSVGAQRAVPGGRLGASAALAPENGPRGLPGTEERAPATAFDLSSLHVLHVIGSLQPGGAERQVVYTAAGLRRAGVGRCDVVVTDDLADPRGSYRAILTQAGITPVRAGDQFDPRFAQALAERPALREAASRLPALLRPRVADLFGEIVVRRPTLVHCWLDHTNIWGGVAAALAGVPAIVLSTRSLGPRHFPHLYQPWFDEWYQALAQLPNVHFANNSRLGAEDYAAWLELPRERFTVILNGVDPGAMPRAGDAEVAALRAELGLGPRDRILAGIFRIGEEKQPDVFVDVAHETLSRFPELHVVLAGSGPLEAAVRARVRRGSHAQRFHLLGRRHDVATILAAAHVLLLTSRVEGTPNVLLEAQHLGCPVVTTAAGGAVDAVLDGVTGFVRPVGARAALVEALTELLSDERRRAAFAAAGPAFVAERFGMGRMIEETIALYRRALAGAGEMAAQR